MFTIDLYHDDVAMVGWAGHQAAGLPAARERLVRLAAEHPGDYTELVTVEHGRSCDTRGCPDEIGLTDGCRVLEEVPV